MSKKVSNSQAETEDKWMLYEEMEGYYPQVVADSWNTGRANDYLKKNGFRARFTRMTTVYTKGICALWVPEKEFKNLSQEILERILMDRAWFDNYMRRVLAGSKRLDRRVEILKRIELKKLSNSELGQLYQAYFRYYENLHAHHWVQTGADAGDNILSKYLLRYLQKCRTGLKVKPIYTVGEAFALLTTPTKDNNNASDYKELLQLLKLKAGELKEALAKHTEKYGWLGYGTAGPGWSMEHYLSILKSLKSRGVTMEPELDRLKIERQCMKNKQQQILAEFRVNRNMARAFEVARGLVYSKNIRKDSIFRYCAAMEPLIWELGRRLRMCLAEARFLYPHELKTLLGGSKIDLVRIRSRPVSSLYYSTGYYKYDTYIEGWPAVQEMMKTLNIIQGEALDPKIIRGHCAMPGRVRGEVVIINSLRDLSKICPGNILVSTVTSPNLLPVMQKASAIITDAGGITCHAAIVARDLRIPCIVGAKVATKVLEDGDVVEVDATHGRALVLTKRKQGN